MKKILFAMALSLSASLSYGQNTFPASGNAGVNTSTPAYNLDVNGTLNANNIYSAKQLIYPTVLSQSERGQYNLLLAGLRTGKRLYSDEQFDSNMNSIAVYNNSSNGTVNAARVAGTNLPNTSGYCIEITHTGTASPGIGGVVQLFNVAANRTYAQIFRAKLPVGYSFAHGSNGLGTGGNRQWLTNNVGTGKWEDYAVLIVTGNAGSFVNAGHLYVTGTTPTTDSPLVWQLASCSAYELSSYAEDRILNQQSIAQNANINITGNGYMGGNVGIGTIDTKGYKLAVNGTAIFTKAVVKLFGNWPDYVFAEDYKLPSLQEVLAYISKEKHLPHIPSEKEIAAADGADIMEIQKALVKTAEEQMLYILQLQQQIDKLNQELKALKAANQ
jgi:hypothetical protein